MSIPESEGTVPFKVSGTDKPCETWYKVFGDLKDSRHTPLIVVHGGPGACHEYLLPLKALTEKYGIPTIFYDQLGNGKSTRLPETKGDTSFWTVQLFIDELNNLVDHLKLRDGGFDYLGQSWGGMLGSEYAATRPKGLRKMIISNSPASMRLWVEAALALRSTLPKDVQRVLDEGERSGNTNTPAYESAVTVFYENFLCLVRPFPPPEVQVALDHLMEDSTTYETLNGPNEFLVVGSLKTWDVTPRLPQIDVEVLLINGEHDEAQDLCVQPFFEHIPKVKWITIDGTSHMSHVEKPEKYVGIVHKFLYP